MTAKCPLCGGKRTSGSTTFTVELGFGVVVIRHVPAQVCDQCGETWLDDPVAAELEEIVSRARAKRSVVDVTEWRAQAA
jgi:YgiT-type zinc finger domain-containing protein